MRDKRISFQKSNTWKIQLKIAAIFICSKDVDEERVMHSKSGNTELMPYDNANEVVNELFELLLSRYQIGLETSIKWSDFVVDSVQLLYYKCHKINFKRGRTYIDSSARTKKKEKQIWIMKLINVYSIASSHDTIERDPQRISKIKTFINKYNWNRIKYPSKIDDWKAFEESNPTIALNILYIKEKQIYLLTFQNVTQPVKSK